MTVSLDFETYSEAGLALDFAEGRWAPPPGAPKTRKGIKLVGAHAYASHPSTEVLVTCYSFDGGRTVHTWRPGEPAPAALLDHVRRGGIVAAWNSFFEWCIWNLVCSRLYGWPRLPLEQTEDSMARALQWGLPGALDAATKAYWGKEVKDAEGSHVMRKLSAPRNLTGKDLRLRYRREDPRTPKERAEWERLDAYCAQDVRAEAQLAAQLPPLSAFEREVWLLDQKINARGVAIDTRLVGVCIPIIEEGRERAGWRLRELTGGAVSAVSQATALLKWVNGRAPALEDLRDETLDDYLTEHGAALEPWVLEALELRQDFGGSAPSKLVAMKHHRSPDGRARGILQYAGAMRTRRWAGRAIQTQNITNKGPALNRCKGCGKVVPPRLACCGELVPEEWGPEGVQAATPYLLTGSFAAVEAAWGNPALVVAGCLRAMLISGELTEFVCADYSAIEAVIIGELAGERWVQATFRGDGKLYERTAATVSGIPAGDIIRHKAETGAHHPKRKMGKVAALASGFQGARGAWLKFGAGAFMSDGEIDAAVKAWRAANPSIVRFWYDCEGAALAAVQAPGTYFRAGGSAIRYVMLGRALYCVLPSGESLTYVDPEVKWAKKMDSEGYRIVEAYEARGVTITKKLRAEITAAHFKWSPQLSYLGAKNSKQVVRQETYGGKLVENIVQATARDLQAWALLNVEAAGYPVVMHTHDEIVAEVPEGSGSVEELERIMSIMPPWAAGWPVRAAGGWRARRFRK